MKHFPITTEIKTLLVFKNRTVTFVVKQWPQDVTRITLILELLRVWRKDVRREFLLNQNLSINKSKFVEIQHSETTKQVLSLAVMKEI